MADVSNVARGVLHPEQLVWVIVGDRAAIEAGIKQLNLGPIHFVDADGNEGAPSQVSDPVTLVGTQNAALLGALMPIANFEAELWYKVLQVNLNAPFLLTRASLPLLSKSADATVLFNSDRSGRRGKAYWGAYAASKAATENFMQVLADELETNTAVRVNSIDPGLVTRRLKRKGSPSDWTPKDEGPLVFLNACASAQKSESEQFPDLPAEWASSAPACRARAKPSAIWLRQEFPVQRKTILKGRSKIGRASCRERV